MSLPVNVDSSDAKRPSNGTSMLTASTTETRQHMTRSIVASSLDTSIIIIISIIIIVIIIVVVNNYKLRTYSTVNHPNSTVKNHRKSRVTPSFFSVIVTLLCLEYVPETNVACPWTVYTTNESKSRHTELVVVDNW